jgi:hypothetical protein
LDRLREKWGSITYSQGREEYPTYNKVKGFLRNSSPLFFDQMSLFTTLVIKSSWMM